MIVTIRQFGGLQADRHPALVQEGMFCDVRNVDTRNGTIRKRSGVEVDTRLETGDGARWPVLIWHDSRTDIDGGQNRNLNAPFGDYIAAGMRGDPS